MSLESLIVSWRFVRSCEKSVEYDSGKLALMKNSLWSMKKRVREIERGERGRDSNLMGDRFLAHAIETMRASSRGLTIPSQDEALRINVGHYL